MSDTKWEYCRFTESIPLSIEHLNLLGSEGWELTSIIHTNVGVIFYFKRKVSEEVQLEPAKV